MSLENFKGFFLSDIQHLKGFTTYSSIFITNYNDNKINLLDKFFTLNSYNRVLVLFQTIQLLNN